MHCFDMGEVMVLLQPTGRLPVHRPSPIRFERTLVTVLVLTRRGGTDAEGGRSYINIIVGFVAAGRTMYFVKLRPSSFARPRPTEKLGTEVREGCLVPSFQCLTKTSSRPCRPITCLLVTNFVIFAQDMQTLTEQILLLNPPGGLFDQAVLAQLFPGSSQGARKLLLHRAVAAQEIQRLARGLYLLAPPLRRQNLHPFALAGLIHGPSQVSLESALSYHGLIPEGVREVASVTQTRSHSVKNSLGIFRYHRVPSQEPLAGVSSIQVDGLSWALVARPLRALADLIYPRKTVRWKEQGLSFLTGSLRIEEDDLGRFDLADLAQVTDSLRDRRTVRYLEGLARELAP